VRHELFAEEAELLRLPVRQLAEAYRLQALKPVRKEVDGLVR
jgi:hypothetical protein